MVPYVESGVCCAYFRSGLLEIHPSTMEIRKLKNAFAIHS